MLTAEKALKTTRDFYGRNKTRKELMDLIQIKIRGVCMETQAQAFLYFWDITFDEIPEIRYYVVHRLKKAGYSVGLIKDAGGFQDNPCLRISW